VNDDTINRSFRVCYSTDKLCSLEDLSSNFSYNNHILRLEISENIVTNTLLFIYIRTTVLSLPKKKFSSYKKFNYFVEFVYTSFYVFLEVSFLKDKVRETNGRVGIFTSTFTTRFSYIRKIIFNSSKQMKT